MTTNVAVFVGSRDDFVREQLHRLKAIARLAGAYLQEPTDPTMREALDGLRLELAAYHELKQSALRRGWQT